MQKVYLSKTMSGTLGYFTNGMLVMGLTSEQVKQDSGWHIKFCERLGFEFNPKPTWEV